MNINRLNYEEISYEELHSMMINKYRENETIKIRSRILILNHERYEKMEDGELIKEMELFKMYHKKHNELKRLEKTELRFHDDIRREYRRSGLMYSEEMEMEYKKLYLEYSNMFKEYESIFEKWFVYHYNGENKKKASKKIKKIGKKEISKLMDDVCGICLENHEKLKTIETCCNHSFGKCCFDLWSKSCKKEKKVLRCPLCKKENPNITSFKLCKSVDKKVSVKKLRLIIEEDEV